ncbi:YchF/TatD family DNA exonuclease [Candidatus Sumerlaeota bacterium]|nr:YchF/TatD family DNA exonuclease [Candidatus Sumerlaeota bacterium]
MGIIDSHTHLTDQRLHSQVEAVIHRARLANIEHMVTIGDGPQDGQQALELARRFENVSCTIGAHPHHASRCDDAALKAIRKSTQAAEVVAVGEIGLDYYYGRDYAEAQKDALLRQLELAAQIGKPVVIHCREAFDDLFAALDRQPVPKRGIVHCFTGTLDEARECVKRGFKVGFTGVVTFDKAEDIQEIAAAMRLEDLLIETDAPYLAPNPKRGKTNEPALTYFVARRIAELRKIPLVEVIEAARRNTIEIYALNLPSQSPLLIRDGSRAWLCAVYYHAVIPQSRRALTEPALDALLAAIDGAGPGLEEVWLGGYADPLHRPGLVAELAQALKQRGLRTGLITSGMAETQLSALEPDWLDQVRFQLMINGDRKPFPECPVAADMGVGTWESFASNLHCAMERPWEVSIQSFELPGAKINAARHTAERQFKLDFHEMTHCQRF